MTGDEIKVSQDLEFPAVALARLGYMPAKGGDEQGAAQILFVAATRTTRGLVIGAGRYVQLGERFG